jgi:hypothetical protein
VTGIKRAPRAHRGGASRWCKLIVADGPSKRAWLRLAAGLAAAASVGGTVSAETQDIAVLRALDKVTARISTIEAPVGQPVTFGTLQIIARTCDKRPPEEPPEAAAFLHVEESRPNEVPVTVFRSWMFASSPAVSAMDHPIYDIWVLDCISSASTARSSETDSSE